MDNIQKYTEFSLIVRRYTIPTSENLTLVRDMIATQ